MRCVYYFYTGVIVFRCVIISGGTVGNPRWLAGMLRRDDRIICVDGGLRHAVALGITPHLVVGDMDSVDQGELGTLSRLGVKTKEYPAEKDDTDTALALAEALAEKPDEILIIGALGTRFDHSLANVHLLRVALESGVRARVANEFNDISLVVPGESVVIEGKPGEIFSLLPLTPEVTGVNVAGAHWPLLDAVFKIGNPYGISNRLSGERVEISIASGLMLLIKVDERGEMKCR